MFILPEKEERLSDRNVRDISGIVNMSCDGKKIRVLLLSQYHEPEPNFKSQALACELKNLGFSVTVLTGFPNYPEGVIYPGYRQKPWRKECIDGITVIRTPLFPYHGKSKLRRVLNYLSFSLSAGIVGLVLVRKIDLIWVYHPPLTIAIPALILRFFKRASLIYDIQDLWPETLSATGMAPPEFIMKRMHGFAKYVYKKADRIVVISNGFKENLLRKKVPESKIRVIPNWADERYLFPSQGNECLSRKLGLDKCFVFMFAGTIGEAQGLENLLKVAEALNNPRIKIVLLGNGSDLPRLKNIVLKKKIAGIIFLDRQPISEMNTFLALADVMLVHLKKDPLFNITVPSKTTAYMAAGKPILGVLEGEAADHILSSGSGWVCEPENTDKLGRLMLKISELEKEDLARMGLLAREYYLHNFQKKTCISKYYELFVDIVSGK